jgi:hypothetical protein
MKDKDKGKGQGAASPHPLANEKRSSSLAVQNSDMTPLV